MCCKNMNEPEGNFFFIFRKFENIADFLTVERVANGFLAGP